MYRKKYVDRRAGNGGQQHNYQFGRIDVELTKEQAEKLKVLLIDALERGGRDLRLRGVNKSK